MPCSQDMHALLHGSKDAVVILIRVSHLRCWVSEAHHLAVIINEIVHPSDIFAKRAASTWLTCNVYAACHYFD